LNIKQHNVVECTSKWEAEVNRGIWKILPQRAAEFREPTRGIWQNCPQKTVVPTYILAQAHTTFSTSIHIV